MKVWARATGVNWTVPNTNGKIYMGHEDGKMREWNFNKDLKKFTMGYDEWYMNDAVRDIVLIPNYDLMISCCRNGVMRIWDTETYDFYYLCTHHTDDVATVAVSPDVNSRIIATASWD